MSDNQLNSNAVLLHLDAMESRIRSDIAEVRKDTQAALVQGADHEARLDHTEKQLRWIWEGFGSTLLAAITALGAHLLGWIGVGTHHAK